MTPRGVVRVLLGGLVGLFALSAGAAAQAKDCRDLAGLRLAAGVVESAQAVAAGEAIAFGDMKAPAPVAFCRVRATLRPTVKSDIRVEFWLPERAAWNEKFLGAGNAGFGGQVGLGFLRGPLLRGYAAAGNDTGHATRTNTEAKWAYRHPEELIDWAYRANHLTAEAGKQLIRAYYGRPPERSYFEGCSDGGREALMEALRFPADYDGVIAGAPAANFTDVMAQFAWDDRLAAGANLTAEKLKLVTDAMLARCDGLDGVKDGVVESPLACPFDPAELRCRSGAAANCLTAAQVDAIRAISRGPRTRKGTRVSYGFPIGGGLGAWSGWITNPTGGPKMALDFYRWMVLGKPGWSLADFNLDRDWPVGRARLASLINSDSPDLQAFVRRGGKLILYHGWSDPALPPQNTISYYEALRHRLGPAAADHARLFMAPGMSHCFFGDGPNMFDMVSVLNAWVEGGPAPERVIATKYDNDMAALLGAPAKVVRTRPLCAWPTVARWDGKGSPDKAESFACVAPGRPPAR